MPAAASSTFRACRSRRLATPAALLLLTGVGLLGPVPGRVQDAVAAPATQDLAALGDDFGSDSDTAWATGYDRLLDGPELGVPTATVDAGAGTATITFASARRTSSLTVPWPLAAGPTALSATGSAAQRVTATRGTASCVFTSGSLQVNAAAQRAGGGGVVLDADVSGACALRAASSERLEAAVRIGASTPLPAVPVADPARWAGGALTGEVVERAFTVTNRGGRPWHVRLVGTGAQNSWHPTFGVVPGADTCTGAVLDPGAACSVTVSGTAHGYAELEHLVVRGDGVGELVVPLVLGGHAPVPPPTAVVGAPGRLSSRLSWQPPVPAPRYGYRVYDVTSGSRTLVATASSTASDVLVSGAGPRKLAVVAYAGEFAESTDVVVDVPAVTDELVVGDGYDAPLALPGVGTAPGRSLHLLPGSWALSPDGQELLSGRNGAICRLADEVCTPVPGLPAGAAELEWLPEGKLVAVTDGSDTREIWVLGRNGSGPRRVATLPWVGGLTVAPDGLSVFVLGAGDNGVLRVRLSDGARTVVPGTRDADGFTVSRAGRLVVERRLDRTQEAGPRRSTVMGLDGSSPHELALPRGDNRAVSFDPGGTRLVWARHTGSDEATLWTSAADGSGARQLSDRVGDWKRPQWYVTDATAPATTLTGAAWSGATASWSITASDPDDAVGFLRRECRLDAGAWTPCGATWRLTGLRAGVHTASARAIDPAGLVGPPARRTWTVDATAPSAASLSTLPTVLTARTLALRWSAVDTGGSGLRSYDVRRRSAPSGSGFGARSQPAGLQALASTGVSVPVTPGTAYCFSVRARDAAGNAGAWSPERCASAALDDRSLSASSGWSRSLSSTAAYGTTTVSATRGARLVRSTVQARRVGVLVTTCSGCGSVDVYLAGTRLGAVSTSASSTAYRQVRWLPQLAAARTGALELRTTSSRRVIIDGVALGH